MIAPHDASLDLSFVDQAVERLGRRPEAVIPILQAIQAHYRYLPEPALERVCWLTEITPAQITGVATFYKQFRHRPVGRHMISVCHGTACHVKGSELVQDALQHRLKLCDGEDTDRDGLFTVQKVACLGCCTLAPVVQIDGVTYGRLTPSMVPEVLGDFLHREKENGNPPRLTGARCSPGGHAGRAAFPFAGPHGRIANGPAAGRDPRRAGLLLRGPGERQGPRRDLPRAGGDRGRGRGQAGGLRGHVPPDAAGGDRARPGALEAFRQGGRGGRAGDRAGPLPAPGARAADRPARRGGFWTGC